VTSGTRLMGSWTVLDETAVELTETTIKGSKHGTRRRAWGVSMCFFSDHFGDSSFGFLDLIRLRAAGAVCRCKSTQPIEANPALESHRPPLSLSLVELAIAHGQPLQSDGTKLV
jgi:hypothetical protein